MVGTTIAHYRIRIAGQLAQAVGAARERGIVHRDLKPANVMIAGDGRVKVLDFGLAKLKPDHVTAATGATVATEPLTEAHHIVGTVAYMSPEQAEGLAVDHRPDVLSLGTSLFEMATGARPFTAAASRRATAARCTSPAG